MAVTSLLAVFGPAEMNQRSQVVPPNQTTHVFKRCLTNLRNVSGKEHSQVAGILVGIIAGQRSRHAGQGMRADPLSNQVVRAARAMIVEAAMLA